MALKDFVARLFGKRGEPDDPLAPRSKTPGDMRELSNRLADKRGKNITIAQGTAVPKAEAFDPEALADTAADMRYVNFSSEEDALSDGAKNASYRNSKDS